MKVSNQFKLKNTDLLQMLPFSLVEISRKSNLDTATCRKFFNGEIVSRVSQAKIIKGLKEFSELSIFPEKVAIVILDVKNSTERLITLPQENT